MSNKIDSTGTFKGVIKGTGLGETKKSGLPQAILDLTATQKYVESPEDIAHFKAQGMDISGPAWVDWSGYNESTVAYLVLFKSKEEFSKETALMNYDQIQIATGWDGLEFDSFANGSFIGKEILFRVETNDYDGKTSLQVNWVDHKDANPERTLKSIDTDAIKALNKKLKFNKAATPPKPAAVAAKPIIKPPAPVAANPTPASPAIPSSEANVTATPPNTSSATAASPSSPPRVAATPGPEAPVATTLKGLPVEATQLEAWNYVCKNKGANADDAVQDAWVAAVTEISEATKKDEDTFAPAEWAKIRDIVLNDLGVAA